MYRWGNPNRLEGSMGAAAAAIVARKQRDIVDAYRDTVIAVALLIVLYASGALVTRAASGG